MKKVSRFLTISTWAVLIYVLFRLDLLKGNIDNLTKIFDICGKYKEVLFITLSSLRIVALIPSSVFMLLGGMLFNPLEGLALTSISVIFSETIIYVTSRILVGSKIQSYLMNKYPKLSSALLRNNIKILAIGILCPIAPSDVACFLASSTSLKYKNFILTIIIANMPMMLLYNFLGSNILSSIGNTIIIVAIIILISGYSIYIWNKAENHQKLV